MRDFITFLEDRNEWRSEQGQENCIANTCKGDTKKQAHSRHRIPKTQDLEAPCTPEDRDEV